jgi:phosphoribosylanthranilate isomerase
MKRSKKPRVKICCISSRQEAIAAIDFGASALGLVGDMPSGPGVITDQKIQEIAATVPPPIATFLLTSRTNATDIIAHQQKVKTNTIQIVDQLIKGTYLEIREALPGIRLVQVIHVTGEEVIEEAIRVSSFVDAILVDSGNPALQVKVLGGTGKIHNWEISRKIRESINVPLFLAGGLNAANIRQAVEIVQPFGIDLCSSVRTNGKLDLFKLEQFFEEVEKVSC